MNEVSFLFSHDAPKPVPADQQHFVLRFLAGSTTPTGGPARRTFSKPSIPSASAITSIPIASYYGASQWEAPARGISVCSIRMNGRPSRQERGS